MHTSSSINVSPPPSEKKDINLKLYDAHINSVHEVFDVSEQAKLKSNM